VIPARLSRRQLLATTAAGLASASLGAPSAAAQPDPVSTTSPPATAAPRALFIGHGGPDLARRQDRGAELRAMLPSSPSAFIAVTPHRRTDVITVAGAKGGEALRSFPKRFHPAVGDLDYRPPAAPALATQVIDRLKDAGHFASRRGHVGFNHTVWGPLLHLAPAADVPVVEVGMPFDDDEGLVALGRALGPLAAEGALLLASGQLTHNLAEGVLPEGATSPASWAQDFDAWANETVLARDVDALLDWRDKAPADQLAHPDDGGHFRVLHIAMGFALGAPGGWQSAASPHDGFDGGTFSRRGFTFG
jgi:4,5-DOPA dioxygenase extradiol